MPCEACNTQFTVFRRKKSCMECRRLYCNQCLVKRSDRAMCKRCVVFTTRPLCKDELLKQKPKDLIYFLQSKHISTTGCIEKEELVNLVLIHCNNAADLPPSGDENCANPFDQIKQTCHNLFTSFTEKIATDLNFDLKSNASTSSSPTSPTQPQSPSSQQNIFSQPRASRRPSGSYSSTTSSGGTAPGYGGHSSAAASASARPSPTASAYSPPPQAPQPQQPSSPPTRRSPSDSPSESVRSKPTKRTRLGDMAAGTRSTEASSARCKCSSAASGAADEDDDDDDDDDVDAEAHNEMITQFRRSQSQHSDLLGATSPGRTNPASPTSFAAVAGPSGQHFSAPSQPPTAAANKRTVVPTPDSDETSSFEELAGSMATASGPLTDADNWQIIDHATEATETPPLLLGRAPSVVDRPPPATQPIETDALVGETPSQQPRRGHRRRSESALLAGQSPRRHFSIDDAMDDDNHGAGAAASGIDDLRPPHRHSNDQRRACDRCGNNPKAIMRRHVARFRRQLEMERVDEAQMRRELNAFLAYLEQSQLLASSQDGGDEDAEAATATGCDDRDNNGATVTTEVSAARDAQTPAGEPTMAAPNDMDDDDFSFGEDDGIHVYGMDDPMNGCGPAKQFFNLTDIQAIGDLDDLTVKQLKEVLFLNRIDYKGCCEKNELLERVKRLWNERSAAPAVDQLPSDDLCKICMDAPIECVMLECGHMATCTECGKVLNECPICRQYIVRVVRFFRS